MRRPVGPPDEIKESPQAKREREAEQAKFAQWQQRPQLEDLRREPAPPSRSPRPTTSKVLVEEGEGFLDRWGKPLAGVAAVAAVFLVGYAVLGLLRGRHTAGEVQLSADDVWQEYHKDPQAADQKYANQRFLVSGKLVIDQGGKRVWFKPPSELGLPIQCTFSDWGEMDIRNGVSRSPVLISGEFQHYSGGQAVELKNCIYIGESRQQSMLGPRTLAGAELARSISADESARFVN